MGIFDGMGTTRTSGSGRYICPGDFELELRELKVFESQQKKGHHFFCAEWDVLEFTPPADLEGKPQFKAGDEASWLVNLDNASALANIKGLALALVPGSEEEDIDEETMEDMISSKQPAKGAKIFARAFQVATRTGGEFTKVKWSSEAITDDADAEK